MARGKHSVGRTAAQTSRTAQRHRKQFRIKNRKRFILAIGSVVVLALIVVAICLIKPPETEPVSIIEEEIEKEDYEGTVLDIANAADRKEGVYTFLVCGVDKTGGNSDTLIIGSFDTENHKVDAVSIPRDTLVNVSRSVKKINASYGEGGVEGVEKEVKKLTGYTPDVYAVIDLEAFEKVVDAIGGVDFDVPVKMYYNDPYQNLSIHIDKGYQHLTGEEALKVARFRHTYSNGDIGRISVQQDLMKAIAEQCLQVGNITKVKEFSKIFKEYVDCNVSLGNIVWFGSQFLKLEGAESVQFHEFPGNINLNIRGGSYVGVYLDDWITLINQYLNPFETDISKSNLDVLTSVNGQIYATSGTIRGGEDSFFNYGVFSSDSAAEAAAEQETAAEAEKNPPDSGTTGGSAGTEGGGGEGDTSGTGANDGSGSGTAEGTGGEGGGTTEPPAEQPPAEQPPAETDEVPAWL